jgi:hypothetical protein
MGNDESTQFLGSVRNWKELLCKRSWIEGSPSLVQDEKSL